MVRDRGELRFKLDDGLHLAPAGSFVFVPRGTPQCFQTVTDAPARILVMFTPAGMERFFDRFAALSAPDNPERSGVSGNRSGWTSSVRPWLDPIPCNPNASAVRARQVVRSVRCIPEASCFPFAARRGGLLGEQFAFENAQDPRLGVGLVPAAAVDERSQHVRGSDGGDHVRDLVRREAWPPGARRRLPSE